MARISEVKNFMDDGWEITIKGNPQKELIAIKEFVNHLGIKENIESVISNDNRKAVNMPSIKPQGMLYVLKDESMLEIAKQVINAVEYSVDAPKGLSLLSYDRENATKDKVKELIEYLKVYANWR